MWEGEEKEKISGKKGKSLYLIIKVYRLLL